MREGVLEELGDLAVPELQREHGPVVHTEHEASRLEEKLSRLYTIVYISTVLRLRQSLQVCMS